jgi:uncharacterized metal-binding protein YceD (DUF177 family)
LPSEIIFDVRPTGKYNIPFLGLKIGHHTFEFKVEQAFFAEREYSIVHHGNVVVTLQLERKETMLIALYHIDGVVSSACDRCGEPVEVPVKGEYRIVYKFGFEDSGDESLVVLHPDAYMLELDDVFYELITLSLPNRLKHAYGECNPEVLKLLSNYSEEDEEEEEDEGFEEDFEEE